MQSKEVTKEQLQDGTIVTTEKTTIQKEENIKSDDVKADKYELIIDKHDKLNVTLENSKENLPLTKKSWEKIIKLMPEEKTYALNYVFFSLTKTSEVTTTREIKSIRKGGEKEGYFKKKVPTDNKLKLHFSLNKKEFDIFDKYFKNKSKGINVEEEKQIEESKKEESKKEEPKKEGKKKGKEKTKEEEKQKVEEVKAEVEESEPKPEEPKTKLRSKNQKPSRPTKSDSKKEEDKKEEKKVPEKKVEQEIPVHYVKTVSNTAVQFAHKWRNHPREYGKDSRYCRVCRNTHGLIRKYGIEMCRRCFRERYTLIGFKQTK